MSYGIGDEDDIECLAEDIGNNEHWEEGNGDGLMRVRFTWEWIVEGGSMELVAEFEPAAFGTTVHMLSAAAEDEDGDCIMYVDW